MQKYKSELMELERKIGSNGEIIIPEEFRKKVGIKPEINVKIGIKNNEIFIKKEENFIEWLREKVKKFGVFYPISGVFTHKRLSKSLFCSGFIIELIIDKCRNERHPMSNRKLSWESNFC